MNPKVRIPAILKTIGGPSAIDLWHTPEIAAMLCEHCGVADDHAMWTTLGLDKIVWDIMDYQTDVRRRAVRRGCRERRRPHDVGRAPRGRAG